MRNGVLLYKQLILPMTFYACPVWRSIALSHIRKLQVLQSKCLCIATSETWNIGNTQVNENLRVPFFTDHVRSLERLKVHVRNPLVTQLGRYLG